MFIGNKYVQYLGIYVMPYCSSMQLLQINYIYKYFQNDDMFNLKALKRNWLISA